MNSNDKAAIAAEVALYRLARMLGLTPEVAGDQAYSAVFEIRNRPEAGDEPSGTTDAAPSA